MGISRKFPHWEGSILKNSHVLVCETLVFRIRLHRWEDFQGILSPVRPYLESNRAWKSELQGPEIWDPRVRNLRYKGQKSEIQEIWDPSQRPWKSEVGGSEIRWNRWKIWTFSAYNNAPKISRWPSWARSQFVRILWKSCEIKWHEIRKIGLKWV